MKRVQTTCRREASTTAAWALRTSEEAGHQLRERLHRTQGDESEIPYGSLDGAAPKAFACSTSTSRAQGLRHHFSVDPIRDAQLSITSVPSQGRAWTARPTPRWPRVGTSALGFHVDRGGSVDEDTLPPRKAEERSRAPCPAKASCLGRAVRATRPRQQIAGLEEAYPAILPHHGVRDGDIANDWSANSGRTKASWIPAFAVARRRRSCAVNGVASPARYWRRHCTCTIKLGNGLVDEMVAHPVTTLNLVRRTPLLDRIMFIRAARVCRSQVILGEPEVAEEEITLRNAMSDRLRNRGCQKWRSHRAYSHQRK